MIHIQLQKSIVYLNFIIQFYVSKQKNKNVKPNAKESNEDDRKSEDGNETNDKSTIDDEKKCEE